MIYIGLDVHQQCSTYELYDPATEERHSGKIHTTREEFAQLLADLSEPIVALEACRQSPLVCRWLLELGAEVHLADPFALQDGAMMKRRAKTDRKDAKVLLDKLVAGNLPEAYLAPEEVAQARTLSRCRDQVRKISTQLRNQVGVLLELQDRACRFSDLRGKQAQEYVESVFPQLPPLLAYLVSVLWNLLGQVEEALGALDDQIRREVEQDPVCEVLTQIPGVGPIIAYGLRAELGEIERFPTAKYLHSYAGVVPRVYQSGEQSATGRLPRDCPKHLRYLAVLAVQCAVRCRGKTRVKDAYLRVKRRYGGKANPAKIAAARALLTDVYHRWQKAQA